MTAIIAIMNRVRCRFQLSATAVINVPRPERSTGSLSFGRSGVVGSGARGGVISAAQLSMMRAQLRCTGKTNKHVTATAAADPYTGAQCKQTFKQSRDAPPGYVTRASLSIT